MRITAEFRAFIATAIPQVITLLNDRDWEIRREAIDSLAKLSQQGKITKIFLSIVPDEHHSRVSRVHCSRHSLYHHPPQWCSLETSQGGCKCIDNPVGTRFNNQYSDLMSLMRITVEFRVPIIPVIPQVISLLNDSDWEVRREAVDSLVKLSEQGNKITNFIIWHP